MLPIRKSPWTMASATSSPGFVGLEPCDQRIDLRKFGAARRRLPLLRPATDLPVEIVSRPAEVAKADGGKINRMQRGERLRHGVVHRGPVDRRNFGQRAVVEDPSFDPLHQIEGRADNLVSAVEEDRAGDRHPGALQRLEHAIFAIDRVSRSDERTSGPLAQHHPTPAEIDKISRIGLPTRDP